MLDLTIPRQDGPRSRGRHTAALVAVVAVSLFAAAACGASGEEQKGSGSGLSSSALQPLRDDLDSHSALVTSYPEVSPVSGVADLAGKNVWYVPIGAAVPVLAAIGDGVDQALSSIGVHVHTCDGKFLATTAASCLAQAESQGADGVITSYIDYMAAPNAFESLAKHNIPVLVAGEANNSGKEPSSSLAFGDTTPTVQLLGKLAMEKAIVESKGKASILFLAITDSPQTKSAAEYTTGFAKKNCPGCSITQVEYHTASIDKVPSQISAALVAHPETDYVVLQADAAGPGAVQGIQTAGYASKVKLIGSNGNLDALQRIKAGQIQVADAGLSSTYLGWQFADGIVRMMTGGVPDLGVGVVRLFDTDNVGNLDLTPAGYATNAWYGSDDYKKTFLDAWGQ